MHLPSCLSASLLLALGLSLAACSDSPTPPDSAPDPTQHVSTDSGDGTNTVLRIGKSDLALPPGRYASPPGFIPPLQVTVSGSGWRSTHRGPDGFDLSRPDPTKDAPLVALVIIRPVESDTTAALAALQGRAADAGSATRLSTMTVGGETATVVTVHGSQGELVRSALDGIALDAGGDQRLRVVVTEFDGHPMEIAVYVPDRERWAAGLEAALPLLTSLVPSS